MKKISFIFCFAVFTFLITTKVSYSAYDISVLSNGTSGNKSYHMNANGHVVWSGYTGSSGYEIFLYDGTSTTQITDNAVYYDDYPQINANGHVVWQGKDEIFLYNGTITTQLTNNAYDDRYPQINANGHVVWDGNGEIFLYDGTSTTQITDNAYADNYPKINANGHIVWDGNGEIFLYDGTTITQLTDNAYADNNPKINANGHVVWDGNGEIFLYDGTTITQLTDNDYSGFYANINVNGQVAWEGGSNGTFFTEIFVYDGTSITQLTDNAYIDYDASINANGQVAWIGDGGNRHIYLATPIIVTESKITITPSSGSYVTTQDFDLVLMVEAENLSVDNIHAKLNNINITPVLDNCFIHGTITSGGESFRCPGFNTKLLNIGIEGTNKLRIVVVLNDGSRLKKVVQFKLISNTEP